MCIRYALLNVLYLCTLCKKQAERGCFSNIPFQRLIPESNEKKCVENGYELLWIGLMYMYICFSVYLRGLEYTADEWNDPHSKIGVSNEGALGLDFTAIYVVVTVAGCSHPKHVIRDGEEGISCTVATHSIG